MKGGEKQGSYHERAVEKAQEAKAKGRNVERVMKIITQATSQHQGVLTEVLERIEKP